MRLSGNGQISLERSGTIVKAFRGFSAFWGPRKISIAPNQHHPLTDLLEKPGNTAPPLLPSAFSHIHSKTACRGFKSFCPCQKTGENTGFSSVFFFHVLHGYVVHFGSIFGFSHSPAPAAPPLQHPKRTRFCPFWAFPGAFFSFSLFSGC